MLALCLMLLATYYAQNYAGIIGWSLHIRVDMYVAIGTENQVHTYIYVHR